MIEDYFSEKYYYPSWQEIFLERMFKKDYEGAERVLDLFPYRSSSKEDVEFREMIVNEARGMIEDKSYFNDLRRRLNSPKDELEEYGCTTKSRSKRKGIIYRLFTLFGINNN